MGCACGCHAQDNVTLLSSAGWQELSNEAFSRGEGRQHPAIAQTAPPSQGEANFDTPAPFAIQFKSHVSVTAVFPGVTFGVVIKCRLASTANVPNLCCICSCLMRPAVITAK